MLSSVFTSITVINIFTLIVLVIFFFFNRKGNILTNKLLSALLFVFFLHIFYSYAVSNWAAQYFINHHKIIYIVYQTGFLIGPLTYLYFQKFIKNSYTISFKELLHFIPFIGVIIFLIIYYTSVNIFIIWFDKPYLYIIISILVHNVIYLHLSIQFLYRNNIRIKGFIRELKNATQTAGLQFFLLSFIVFWIVNLHILASFMVIENTSWCAYTSCIWALTAFFILTAFLLIVLYKPNIFFIKEKYKSSDLDQVKKEHYLSALEIYMKENKPYLEPELTVNKISEWISIKEKYISQIINEIYGTNFRNYINNLRLEDSIKKLSDPNNSSKTILEIMYSSGFNSKTVFNCLFKEHTGLTPSEFRKKNNY